MLHKLRFVSLFLTLLHNEYVLNILYVLTELGRYDRDRDRYDRDRFERDRRNRDRERERRSDRGGDGNKDTGDKSGMGSRDREKEMEAIKVSLNNFIFLSCQKLNVTYSVTLVRPSVRHTLVKCLV